jgi:hypothetical protein
LARFLTLVSSAAQAYNRHDSRAAKALSLRGQSENNLMREAHREAASILYEERNKDHGSKPRELYVDLHGKFDILKSRAPEPIAHVACRSPCG